MTILDEIEIILRTTLLLIITAFQSAMAPGSAVIHDSMNLVTLDSVATLNSVDSITRYFINRKQLFPDRLYIHIRSWSSSCH